MGEIRSFRDLGVWKRGMDLVVGCYRLSEAFPKSETYGLSSQLRRAAVSIPSNIAEGHTRQHTREFLHFVSIAQGSLAELETQILIAERLAYVTTEQIQPLLFEITELGRMLSMPKIGPSKESLIISPPPEIKFFKKTYTPESLVLSYP